MVNHVIHSLISQSPHVYHIMHRMWLPEVALDLEGLAQNRANDHPISLTPCLSSIGLGHIPMRLLCHVCQVDSQTVHVTLAPLMLLSAILAIVVA